MKYAALVGILVIIIGVFWYFSSIEETVERETVDITTDDTLEPAVEDGTVEDTDESGQIATETDGDAVVVDIDSFMYGYSQDEIVVNEGDTVTINLTSSEGLHDWVVDELDVATEIISAGEETSITFVADRVGEFEFYCSVGNHRAQGMVGTLIVQ